MRYRSMVMLGICAAITVVIPAQAQGNNTAAPRTARTPALPQHQTAPLSLSDDQRAKIRAAVKPKDTEVTFKLKATKSAASFEPSVGTKIPSSLKPHPLPRPLVYDIPTLKQYGYLKLKHQVLIIDPMTHKIVDMFPDGST
jgi:Protein of unknown function (DUF1236)